MNGPGSSGGPRTPGLYWRGSVGCKVEGLGDRLLVLRTVDKRRRQEAAGPYHAGRQESRCTLPSCRGEGEAAAFKTAARKPPLAASLGCAAGSNLRQEPSAPAARGPSPPLPIDRQESCAAQSPPTSSSSGTGWFSATRNRGAGRGGWRPSRAGREVRSTFRAPADRARSMAARQRSSPTPRLRADSSTTTSSIQARIPVVGSGTGPGSGCPRSGLPGPGPEQ